MKGTSIMWNYIREEQAALSRMLDDKALFECAGSFPQVNATYIAAHGSSFNGAVVMSDFLSRCMNARVYNYVPANFTHSCHSLLCRDRERCMVVVISQTGTSRELLEAVIHARELGFVVVEITQVTNSPINRLADRRLHLGYGGENSNAKVKGYSNTLLALMIMGIGYEQKHGSMDQESHRNILEELRLCVKRLDRTMEWTVDWCNRYGKDWKMQDPYVLGTGMNYGIAMEGQFKLMKTICIPTMYNDLEGFSHGMYYLIGGGFSILLLRTDGIYRKLAMGTFLYLLGITEKVLMFYAGDEDIGCKEGHERMLKLDHYPLTQSVPPITIAVQVLSILMPETLRQDPNKAANDDYTDFVHTKVT